MLCCTDAPTSLSGASSLPAKADISRPADFDGEHLQMINKLYLSTAQSKITAVQEYVKVR